MAETMFMKYRKVIQSYFSSVLVNLENIVLYCIEVMDDVCPGCSSKLREPYISCAVCKPQVDICLKVSP